MSVITRTNRATNPRLAVDATGYSSFTGSGGGTVSGARNTGAGYVEGTTGFFRTTWTAAGTAIGGGAQYAHGGLSASTQYSHTFWVRSNKAQTVQLRAFYRDAANVDVGSSAGGANVTLVANTWTPVRIVGSLSGVGVTQVVLQLQAVTGGSIWASGDTLDVGFVLTEVGNTAGEAFDGSFTNGGSTMYAWTGTAHASASTMTVYTPVLTTVIKPLFDPTPRVEVTLQDLTPTPNVVTIWRTADGKRQAVRGFRKKEVVTADFVIDYEVPLGRLVSYEIEVVSGLNAQVAAATVEVQVDSASGSIQDPLVPSNSVAVFGEMGTDGAYIRDQALKDLEYAVEASIIPIMGSPDPVGILGQRMAARGVDMSMSTRAAQSATDLRKLLQQAPMVLVRPLPKWGAALPGLCYMSVPSPREQPMDEAWGGSLIRWELVGDLIAAPNMNVLVPIWTYGDVKNLWSTYQQAQTAYTGKKYLDVLKSPSGS